MSHSCGRPPKFNEPRRPITVTLPDRILQQLDALGDDRALAIVKATEAVVGHNKSGVKKVDLVEVAPGVAVIVVGPCASLRRIAWLRLVETAPGRNLLIIPCGMAVDSLEVAIMDLLEKTPSIHDEERALLDELRSKLGSLRREQRISKAEIIFFDTRNLPPLPAGAPESVSFRATPMLSQPTGERSVKMRKHDDKKQLGKKMMGQATRLLLGGALLFLAACGGSSSTGSDSSNSLTVTPGASLQAAVKGPGKMTFNVQGIDMNLAKDSQPIVFFYDSKGFGGGRETGGFQGDLRNYKLKVFDANGLMGDESEKYGYEWRSGDTVAVTIEWTSSSITARVGGTVAVKSGSIPSSFTIGVGYPPSARKGWDGAVYTNIVWP